VKRVEVKGERSLLVAEAGIRSRADWQNQTAATLILDRLQGRPPPQVNLNSITPDILLAPDMELRYIVDSLRFKMSSEAGKHQRRE
jgi:hypothetical protein